MHLRDNNNNDNIKHKCFSDDMQGQFSPENSTFKRLYIQDPNVKG